MLTLAISFFFLLFFGKGHAENSEQTSHQWWVKGEHHFTRHRSDFTKRQIAYSQTKANIHYQYSNEVIGHTLDCSLGQAMYRIKSDSHPFLHQNSFPTTSFSFLDSVSPSASWTWSWGGGIEKMNRTNTKSGQSVGGLVRGMFAYSQTTQYFVGLQGSCLAGQRRTLLPVLGFQTEMSEALSLKAIFPMQLGVSYAFSPRLSTGFHWAFLQTGQKMAEEANAAGKIVEYSGHGPEWSLSYEEKQQIEARLAIGLLKSRLRLMNNHAEKIHQFTTSFTPYMGIHFSYFF